MKKVQHVNCRMKFYCNARTVNFDLENTMPSCENGPGIVVAGQLTEASRECCLNVTGGHGT